MLPIALVYASNVWPSSYKSEFVLLVLERDFRSVAGYVVLEALLSSVGIDHPPYPTELVILPRIGSSSGTDLLYDLASWAQMVFGNIAQAVGYTHHTSASMVLQTTIHEPAITGRCSAPPFSVIPKMERRTQRVLLARHLTVFIVRVDYSGTYCIAGRY